MNLVRRDTHSGPHMHDCVVCGKSFGVSRWRIGTAKTCSMACRLKRVPDRQCDRCGRTFKDRTGRRIFCSLSCKMGAQREYTPNPCLMCGQPCLAAASDRPSRAKDKQLCSFSCARAYQSKVWAEHRESAQLTCKRCGKSLQGKLSHQKKRSFCSNACASTGRKYPNRKKTYKPCAVCAKPFCKWGQTVCSAACGYVRLKLKTRAPLKCDHCQKEYWSLWRGRLKFCSGKCYHASRSHRPAFLSLECAQCGVSFRRTAAAVKRSKSKAATCSLKCRSKYFRGTNNALFRGKRSGWRGVGWAEIAAAIRTRDCHKCRMCGKDQSENGEPLSVDHILPWRSFEDKAIANAEGNLVSLCRPCHQRKTTTIERKWLRGDRMGFMAYLNQIGMPHPDSGPRNTPILTRANQEVSALGGLD